MEFNPNKIISDIENMYQISTEEAQISAAFRYYHHSRNFELISSNRKLVHYTSAGNALKIINGREMWMRNARVMNDFNELDYGTSLVRKIYNRESDVGKNFWAIIDNIGESIFKKVFDHFNGWLYDMLYNTFITCVSEHLPTKLPTEGRHGRLSMWRAYAPANGVALILNPSPFTNVTDALRAYTYPVIYEGEEWLAQQCVQLTQYISENQEVFKNNIQMLKKSITLMFEFFVYSLKHPAFAEEREWRISNDDISLFK